MKLIGPFNPKFWVDDDPACLKYEHERSNVIHLNTPHARANAAQAALSLEEDREGTRRERRLQILQEIEFKRGEIFNLETEYDMLGGCSRG